MVIGTDTWNPEPAPATYTPPLSPGCTGVTVPSVHENDVRELNRLRTRTRARTERKSTNKTNKNKKRKQHKNTKRTA